MKRFLTILTALLLLFSLFLPAAPAAAQTKVSAADARADVDSLVQTLERVHFNPYLHVAPDKFHATAAKLKGSFADSVPLTSFIKELHLLMGLMDDGHSMPAIIQPGLRPELQQPLFLQEAFIRESNRLYVKRDTANSLPAGAEVLSVNGIAINSFLARCDRYFGGPLAHRQDFSLRVLSYLLYLEGLRPPFRFVYRTNGRQSVRIVEKAGSLYRPLVRDIPSLTKAYSFSIPAKGSAYLNYLSMNGDMETWSHYLDSVFTLARDNGCSRLYIDLRDNPGGNSFFNNYLLVYLTKKKFLQSSGRIWRISPDYKKQLLAEGNSSAGYLGQADGSLWQTGDCEPKENLLQLDSVYKFDTYFITGPFTFSSACFLADAVRTFSLGTIIGEPAGEYTNDFGEVFRFTLPRSGIEIQTTISFDYSADCRKEQRAVIQPGIPVKATRKQKINGEDPVMNFIREQSSARL